MDGYIGKILGVFYHGKQLSPASPLLHQQSIPKSPEEWGIHWQKQNQSWRTEPEIPLERQQELARRRAIVPDIEKGIYPFKGMHLSRADVEWLLATHEDGRGPVDWSDESQRNREGLDLRGTDLRGSEGLRVNLTGLPLAQLRAGLSFTERVGLSEDQKMAAMARMDGVLLEQAQLKEAQLGGVSLKSAYLRKAHLQGADLSKAQLMGAQLSHARLTGANLCAAQLENAYLPSAQLIEADLTEAHLTGANLSGVQLTRARLIQSRLEGVNLQYAKLEEADLREAKLNGVNLQQAQLEGANLSEAQLEAVNLRDVTLSNKQRIGPRLADVQWERTNLTVVDWSQVKILGEEYKARQKNGRDGSLIYPKDRATRLTEYETAVRANRQLAVALESQGLNEDAARFAYRAQFLQRKVLWKQRTFGKWFFSMLLALLAGYGYRMWRIIVAYLLIVLLCAGAYFVLGMFYEPHLSFLGAVLTSITAFHGRVFSEPFLRPGDPQLWITAFEAVAGLVVEGVFIAMLAQRFFGK